MDATLPVDLFGGGVVAAPMAGGPSRPDLVRAVGAAGGFGFLAGGYKAPDALAADLDAMDGALPFGVNLFVPAPAEADRDAVLAYRERLLPEAAAVGADVPEPRWSDDDGYPAKLELLLGRVPAAVSFTFALPGRDTVAALRAAGAFVLQTVTCPDEALAAAELGVDALVVQHPDAGGHSGSFLGLRPFAGTLPELVAAVGSALSAAGAHLPVVAAGGIGTPGAAAAARDAGAAAVQLGTAFLRTPEAGTNPVHRAALADPGPGRTAPTRAFSGKWARGLENGFMRRFPDAPSAYPVLHHLTAPMKAASVRAGSPERTSLWAGTGWREGRDEGAAAVVARFAR
ncbi:nitronate monooxygenase [Sinomonas atrocyanea]|uniref:nitronate monooxygenase n=1 Tax=Sinomonas atrocyanea TaxID=37927 RepID=UPI002865A5AE|nr:nitronate monooxygenase [Sinomonas atrocyanea]MDR6622891.1 nitronate monooxygenase [Sinomonas atrocyanea]